MYARVLLALALGQASATNCPTYPCECDDQPGKCIVVGSYGEGGQANLGGVRPHVSEEDCNPGMVMVYDTPQDGKKCKANKRVFKTDSPGCGEDATCINTCIATCEAEPACVAMSIGTNWCAGCEVALQNVASNGAVAYKKVTKCGGEDLPAGAYCKFTFCPALTTDQPTAAPTTSTTSTQTPMPTQCTPVVQTGPTCLNPPGRAPASEKESCSFPAGTENYGIITKEDATIPDKQIYKPILVGGDFTDTHSGNGQIASWCGKPPQNGQTYTPCKPNAGYIKSRIGGISTSPGEFKSGVETEDAPLYPTYLDFAALEELARTITAGTYGSGQPSSKHYVVVLTDTSTVRGTQDLPSINGWNDIKFSDYCTYNGCQDYQWGRFLIVIRSDRKIRLVFGGNPAKMGAMILAPFSKVQVANNIQFVDGLIVAKELEGGGNGVQFHSNAYTGPLKCRPCKDGCD